MRSATAGLAAVCFLLAACDKGAEQAAVERVVNPISYVEIPVTDLDRAAAFYAGVFGFDLERATIDGYDMALFPAGPGGGAAGALAKGDVYRPSREGAIVYFRVADIDAVLARAVALGGSVLYPRKDIGEFGHVAEIADSEGNRIALSQPVD